MKCNNITSYFYQVVNLYFFMGTVWACGDGCALLVPFHGHSTGLRRWLCPPGSISWAQHRLAAVAVPSWFHFMGTAQACGGGCALLVPFHGHSKGLRRWLCPPGSISWAQQRLAAVAVPSWFHFMGTAQACGGGCALLVPFHGHSTGLRRWLCPPGSISWAQHRLAAVAVPSSGSARHKHHISIKKSARIISSLIRALFTIKS